MDRLRMEYQLLFSQPWAMEERAYDIFEKRCMSVQVGELLAKIEVAHPLPLSISGGVATIPINGVLLKTVPGWVRYFEIEATGYDEIRQMVALAVSDPRVERIELRIDSPGGQVAGGTEAADAIRAAAQAKPVTAVVEDLAASAAYWLATSARSITAGRNAEVGSIGVYMVYRDWSKMFEDAGVRTIVIRSGEHKGMGVPGAPISENQIAAEQEVVDQIAEHFIQQVSTGRRMTDEQVRPLATGRVWLAPAALALGLIDGLTGATAAEPNNGKQGETIMEPPKVEQPTAEQAVATERQRIAEINKAFAKDPAFAMEASQAGWTVTEAKAQYCDRLQAKEAATPPGSPGLPYHDSAADGAGGDFMEQARELAEEKKISVTEATKRLAAKNPALHQRFLDAESRRGLTVHGRGKAAGRVSLSR